MGEPARAAPVQVYVGLDSAPTTRERVDLALAEMERTGAFDRSLIMLVSPTGTGYVNYVAVAAAQYLARGDVATVTMQYSKRPSPLSLGKVKDAREQNRLLWLRILAAPAGPARAAAAGRALRREPGRAHQPGRLPALGHARPAKRWASTGRCGSARRTAAGGCTRSPGRTGSTSTATPSPWSTTSRQLEQLGAERRARLRYVLVSHDNDGVTKFGPDLLVTAAGVARAAAGRAPEQVAGASPRGIPPAMRWRPITTFFQTPDRHEERPGPRPLPGLGHDYRPDLARFISEVFELPASRRSSWPRSRRRWSSARPSASS